MGAAPSFVSTRARRQALFDKGEGATPSYFLKSLLKKVYSSFSSGLFLRILEPETALQSCLRPHTEETGE
jgi:hypothetical protein